MSFFLSTQSDLGPFQGRSGLWKCRKVKSWWPQPAPWGGGATVQFSAYPGLDACDVGGVQVSKKNSHWCSHFFVSVQQRLHNILYIMNYYYILHTVHFLHINYIAWFHGQYWAEWSVPFCRDIMHDVNRLLVHHHHLILQACGVYSSGLASKTRACWSQLHFPFRDIWHRQHLWLAGFGARGPWPQAPHCAAWLLGTGNRSIIWDLC